MRKALAQRDHIFHDVLAAFIDARAVHMAVAPDPYKGLRMRSCGLAAVLVALVSTRVALLTFSNV